ncbi:hypothetical protein RIF29_31256 [Crotalaria pallida]|uniref:Secreted protein n=1 Tax=Crotalaria pallida TaxID=3830 RepID=A0AAN9HV59_CROPI
MLVKIFLFFNGLAQMPNTLAQTPKQLGFPLHLLVAALICCQLRFFAAVGCQLLRFAWLMLVRGLRGCQFRFFADAAAGCQLRFAWLLLVRGSRGCCWWFASSKLLLVSRFEVAAAMVRRYCYRSRQQ